MTERVIEYVKHYEPGMNVWLARLNGTVMATGFTLASLYAELRRMGFKPKAFSITDTL